MEDRIPAHGIGIVLGKHEGILSNQVVRYSRGEFYSTIDTLALEAPLTVFLNGARELATMRTPGADRDLAVGMLFTSGRIPRHADVDAARFRETEETVHLEWGGVSRWKNTGAPQRPVPEAGPPTPLAELAAHLLEMRAVLEERQRLHRHTGATHCAMFFDHDRSQLSFGEDVGRHNAFDKCVGSALRRGALDRAHHAVVTSRLSHEIVTKAIRAEIRVLAGFSVATSIAVDLARGSGLTLVGRLRDDTMIIYE